MPDWRSLHSVTEGNDGFLHVSQVCHPKPVFLQDLPNHRLMQFHTEAMSTETEKCCRLPGI